MAKAATMVLSKSTLDKEPSLPTQAPGFTTKQMGDACEMLVAAEMTLAGLPAQKMPDNWPGYDVIAQPLGGTVQRISVKSRRFREGAAFVEYDVTKPFDWLAIVLLPGGYQKGRRIFIVPRLLADKKARKNAPTTKSANQRYWRIDEISKLFPQFEENFALQVTA